jgi:hypothetical protein
MKEVTLLSQKTSNVMFKRFMRHIYPVIVLFLFKMNASLK